MGLFRIIFFVLLGYILFQFLRLLFAARKAAKEGYKSQRFNGKKEKDISHVAKILDEKRLDDEPKPRETGKKRIPNANNWD